MPEVSRDVAENASAILLDEPAQAPEVPEDEAAGEAETGVLAEDD